MVSGEKYHESQRVLNGATINIPSYLVPETENEKGNFPDIKKVIRLGIRISKTIVRLGQKFGMKNSKEKKPKKMAK